MDQSLSPAPPVPVSPEHRKIALFDILYLLVTLWAFAVSLFAPLVGIVLGITFMNWAGTDETRKTGRTCLILGIINIVAYLLLFTIFIAVGGMLTRLPFSTWEGL